MTAFADIVMPKLGLTMTEGVLAEWRVAAGERVQACQILCVVETDKIATEIEASADGEIVGLIGEVGQTLAVGSVIARWTAMAEEPPALSAESPVLAPRADERVVATPLARRHAREHGVDLAGLTGSGPKGRIKGADVQAAIIARAAADTPTDAPPAPSRRQEASALQLVAARRLAEAKRDIPHFYLATEARVDALMALRAQLNAGPQGKRISVTHFVLAAVAKVWAEHPAANRVWDRGAFATFEDVDIGLAVDTSRGLYAPVLRNTGRLGLSDLARAADGLADRAHSGRLTVGEISGGVVTVSNLGMHNVTYLTPIVNPGQSAILGVGTIRAVFRPDDAGRPELRHELGLVLACDHRVFDGVSAARLLNDGVVAYLEAPRRLLGVAERAGTSHAV